MVNLFNLSGPEFLVFYAFLGAGTLLIYIGYIRFRENMGVLQTMDDPYLIAYLRGGANEVLRVVLVSLVERGLLQQTEDKRIRRGSDNSPESVRRVIERLVLEECECSSEPATLFTGRFNEHFSHYCNEFKLSLQSGNFLFSQRVFLMRLLPFMLALALLGGAAAVKINIALSRGRHNVLFLAAMAGVFVLVLLWGLMRRRTALGDAQIVAVKNRFDRLRHEVSMMHMRPRSSFEVTLLAAVFGLSVLPETDYPYIRDLFPRAAANSGNGASGGGCGSSGCGGGGGGGGGCGGGCGGCGD